MISVEQALENILNTIKPLAPEQINISDAIGRVLAQDVISNLTQPPCDISAMDGYAICCNDSINAENEIIKLKIVGEAAAGNGYIGKLNVGKAIRIFTGAPIPNGADSVIMQENTERICQETVIIKQTIKLGNFIRKKGLDFTEGKILITKGKILTARDIALIAAMNVVWLMVYRQPKIAILATGDEIVMPGEKIATGQITSSNSMGLYAAIKTLGAEPILLGIAPDNAESLRQMAAGATGADLLVTTGGASVGDHDLIQKTLGDIGLKVNFWRIAMRPGKPLIFGSINGTPMLGLPGNPVSTMVCSLIFMLPIINKMLGIYNNISNHVMAKLTTKLKANDKRQDYLRAEITYDENGNMQATPFTKQDSAMLSLLSKSDALIIRPPLAKAADAGDMVTIILFPKGNNSF